MFAFKSGLERRKGFVLATAYALVGPVAGASATALAHHSPQGIYHTDRIVEVEGEFTAIVWRNPHVRFTIAATDEQGEAASRCCRSTARRISPKIGPRPTPATDLNRGRKQTLGLEPRNSLSAI